MAEVRVDQSQKHSSGVSVSSPLPAHDEGYWRACIQGIYDAVGLNVYCQGSYENYGKENQVFHPRTERQDGWNDAQEKVFELAFAYIEKCLNPTPEWQMQVEMVAACAAEWMGENSDRFGILCSDVFAWGCADFEAVTNADLQEVYAAWKADPNWGTTRWVIKKRNEQPQLPLKKDMIAVGAWGDELEALPENAYDKWCRDKHDCVLHGAEAHNAPERETETTTVR